MFLCENVGPGYQNNYCPSVSYNFAFENPVADAELRQTTLCIDWQLCPTIFKFIVRSLNTKLNIEIFLFWI